MEVGNELTSEGDVREAGQEDRLCSSINRSLGNKRIDAAGVGDERPLKMRSPFASSQEAVCL